MVDTVRMRVGVSETAERAQDGELAALFDQHYLSLRGLAFVMLGDSQRAEEIVMEAFLKVHSRWGRFRRVESPHAYLRQVVVNGCRAAFRREKVELRVNEMVHRSVASLRDPDREGAMDLWAAVRRLPERQRACVVLRYLEDLPEAEIAELLDCSVGTVKSQLFKARTKLGKALGEDERAGGSR